MVQNFTKFVQNRFEKMIFLFYKSSVTRFGEIPPLWQNFKTLIGNVLRVSWCWAKF